MKFLPIVLIVIALAQMTVYAVKTKRTLEYTALGLYGTAILSIGEIITAAAALFSMFYHA